MEQMTMIVEKKQEATRKTVPSKRRTVAVLRLAWGALVGLSLTLFTLSVPARYAELSGIAHRSLARLGPGDDLLRGLLSGDGYALGVLALEISFVLALALASAAIVWHNSSDWRPLFFSATFVTYSVWVTPTLDAPVLPSVLQTVADLTQAVGLLAAVSFFLVFPDGRFVPGWTRLSALAWAAFCLFWGLFPDSPLSLIDPFGASPAAFLILIVPGWTLGLTAQAIRYRRSNPHQRAQTKWVLLVVAGAASVYALLYLPGLVLPAGGQARLLYDLFGVPAFWLFALPIPIALTAAMLRHHLFEVELLINLTIVYGLLTAVLAGIFEVMVVSLQHVLLTFTGVEDSKLAYFLTALAMAALFEPLKRRIDALVERWFYSGQQETEG